MKNYSYACVASFLAWGLAAGSTHTRSVLHEGPQWDGFEVAGHVEQVFAHETNRHEFVVTVRDGRHRIQTQDHAQRPTRRVAGFDGTDFYQVDTLVDDVGKPAEFGHVYTGCSATNLFGVGDVIRLSFLMDRRDSNRLDALTNMAFFNANRALFPAYDHRLVQDGPPGARFLEKVVFSGNGGHLGGSGDIGAFEVLSTTNIGGLVLPLRSTFSSWLPSIGMTNGSSILESMTLMVTSIGVPSHADEIPMPSVPRVQVWDMRFVSETGQPLVYAITNGVWRTREDPWIVERVHELRLRRLLSEGKLKGRRLPMFLAFGILLTLPLAIHLYLRNGRTEGGA